MSIRRARVFVLVLCLTFAAAAAAQTGRLEPGDAQLGTGEYYDVHEHEGRSGDHLTVTLRSSEFDAYLAVVDPSGGVLLEVDDSDGEGLDVVETLVLPVDGTYQVVVTSTLVLPVDGTYQVVVTSSYGGETGAYLLTIATEANSVPPAPDRLGGILSTTPEPNVVQGVVVAERTGTPIPGANITVAGYSGTGANVVRHATTDAQGRYRLPMVAGLYAVSGEVELPYGDETFHLYLHPVSGHCDQAQSEPGIVADFVLRLAGYQSCFDGDRTNYHSYFGGTISVAPTGTEGLPADALVTFTLEPLGALIDGAPGQPLTFARTVRALDALSGPLDQTRHLYDIPVGSYRLSAVAALPGGGTRQLTVEDWTSGARAAAVDVVFEAVGSFPYGIRVTTVSLYDGP